MVFSNFPTYKQIPGRPNITVSPLGVANGYITNGGADYGPDTPGTETVGLQEAINFCAQNKLSLRIIPGTYNIGANSLTLPQSVGLDIRSFAPNDSASGSPTVVISYSGTSGYAIDSAGESTTADYTSNAKGYMDGIAVYSTASGIRVSNLVYDFGRIEVYGNGTAGGIGFDTYPTGNGAESKIDFLLSNGFATGARIAQDHVSILHYESALVASGGTVLRCGLGGSVGGNVGLTIGYWHHYVGSGGVPAYGIDFTTTGSECHSLSIGNWLWEGTAPTSAFCHSTSYAGTILSIGMLDNDFGKAVPLGLLEIPTNYYGVSVRNIGAVTPMGFGVTTPAVPASGTAIQNTNAFTVRIYVLTASGVTYTITDPYGNVSSSISASAGSEITLDPGASITPTYTTLTWKWYGE